MALDDKKLADDIQGALDGKQPTKITSGMAKDIVDHLKTGIVAGPMAGIAPPSGGDILLGAATENKIILIPIDLIQRFLATFGENTKAIIGMATAISTHITKEAIISFKPGSITGSCTNTPTSPGTFTGKGEGGEISGLSGKNLAKDMLEFLEQTETTEELVKMCTAITDHIQENGEALYSDGSLQGACLPGGGPVIGVGAGGEVS